MALDLELRLGISEEQITDMQCITNLMRVHDDITAQIELMEELEIKHQFHEKYTELTRSRIRINTQMIEVSQIIEKYL